MTMAAQSKYFCTLRTCLSAAEICLLILSGGRRQRKRNRPRRREREKDKEGEEVSHVGDAMASRLGSERGVGAEDSPSYLERYRGQASPVGPDSLQVGVGELSDQLRQTQLSTEAGWKETVIGGLTRRLSAASSGLGQERSSSAPKPESKALPESEILQTEMTPPQRKAPQFQIPAETEQAGTGGTASEAGMKNDPAPMTEDLLVGPVAALPADMTKTNSELTNPNTTTTVGIIAATEPTTKIDIRTQIIPEKPISDIDTASDEKRDMQNHQTPIWSEGAPYVAPGSRQYPTGLPRPVLSPELQH